MMCPVYSNIKGDLIKRAHTKSIESSFAVAYLAYESQFAVIEAKRYIVMSFCRILKRMLDLTRPKVRKWGMMSLALCSFTYTACVESLAQRGISKQISFKSMMPTIVVPGE